MGIEYRFHIKGDIFNVHLAQPVDTHGAIGTQKVIWERTRKTVARKVTIRTESVRNTC